MATETPPAGPEPGTSAKLQILATEHWSLLATRSLTYTESLGRVQMFLAILSGSVIALALVAQADRFGPTFIAVAIFMLAVVFFVGVATMARLMSLNRDDFRWVLGMNRLRNAYFAMYPELAPHFMTSPYDDLPGLVRARHANPARHAVGDSSCGSWSNRSPGRGRHRRSIGGSPSGGCGRICGRFALVGKLGTKVCKAA